MFKETLNNIVERTEGAMGAIIMGTDGIAVEKVMRAEGADANLDVAAAEFTSYVRNAQRTGRDMGFGSLREIVIALDGATMVMRLFNHDYFIALALKPDGNIGRGRFELRKAELQLAREFAV
jgi:predicted regulator of Ras-like GTPase activity (Roadblock/LC7/MglB family)